MKPVVLNPVAVADLDEITDYVAADNPQAASEVRRAIIETAEMLGNFPSLGCRPSFSAPRFTGIRFIPAKRYRNYLVFYREAAEEVEILRVLHAARDGRRFFRE